MRTTCLFCHVIIPLSSQKRHPIPVTLQQEMMDGQKDLNVPSLLAMVQTLVQRHFFTLLPGVIPFHMGSCSIHGDTVFWTRADSVRCKVLLIVLQYFITLNSSDFMISESLKC